eukprot:gene20975-27182_t
MNRLINNRNIKKWSINSYNNESTPNPHSMKFIPDKPVLPEEYGSGLYIQRNDMKEIKKSPLAKQLFSISGVNSIFLGNNFITVTKGTEESCDSEIVAAIKELLESRIRPSVQEDGGDIYYVGFDELTGMVKVRLAGSCVGCPSSAVTLRNGVENMLKHYIPEVKGIEEIPNPDININDESNKLSFTPEQITA